MTIQDILDYISNSPANSNVNVLKTMVQQVAEADNPDLSGITAGADQILSGYKSVDKDGKAVTGSCTYNIEIPAEAAAFTDEEWAVHALTKTYNEETQEYEWEVSTQPGPDPESAAS